MSKVKICGSDNHDWRLVGKCKDALGNHPCDYFPEGCNTCLTRFECYTKESDTYRMRLTGIFYECRKCPTLMVEGLINEWVTHTWRDTLDIRTHSFHGMDRTLIDELQSKWKEE